MTKKIFAMFLALLMVVSMLPTSVFAAGCPAVHTKDNCEYTQVGEPVAPTCGAQGYTRYKCNACGKEFIADQVPAAGEHTWVDAEDVPETCEQDGLTGGKTCSVCKKTVDQTKVDNIPNDDDVKCVWEDLTPNIDCTTGGTKQYQCKVCGAKKEGTKIEENTPHSWTEWTLKTAATAEVPGLAERKCSACNKVEECVVFAAHDHVMVDGESKEPKCEEAGVEAHKVCRICGVKFQWEKPEGATAEQWVEKTDADLAIPTLHEQIKDELNCMTTTYPCDECGEVIKVDKAAAHVYTNGWQNVEEPTCTTDGFEKRICTVCGNTETRIIDALGHIERSWTVDAICNFYGYTFTYCLRADCAEVKSSTDVKIGNTEVEFDLTKGFTNLAEPVVGAGFYMSMVQGKLEKTLYFTGAMDGYYFATSENIADAVLVYLEEVEVEGVEKAYRMYFFDGETKNYMAVIKNGTYNNVKFGAEYAENYWTWNAEYGVLTTKAGEDEFFLGTNGNATYRTISACKMKYVEENFLAQMTVSNANGVALLDIEVDVEAGFATENHKWKDYNRYPATCLTTGQLVEECEYCGKKTEVQTLPIGEHAYVEVKEPATCLTDGKSTKTCSVCGDKVETVLPATGHTPEKYPEGHEKEGQIKIGTTTADHLNTMYWDYYTCATEGCGVQYNEHNHRLWADTDTTFETMEEALAAHKYHEDGETKSTFTKVKDVRAENECTGISYTEYKCSGCEKNVKVKIAGTGEHLPYNGTGITVGEGEEAKTYGNADGQLPMREEATCLVDGYFVNYKCSRCEKLIDETKKENEVVVLKAEGHSWKELTEAEREALGLSKKYEAAPCDQPNYQNYTHKCEVEGCDALKNDGTEHLNTFTVPSVAGLCGEMVYEWYTCHCGENHMRNFVGKIAHSYVDATEDDEEALADVEGFDGELTEPATCTEPGYIWKKCTHCGEFKKEVLDQLKHQNKDEEEFVDSCVSTVTDRHCVLCCACAEKKDHDCTADQNETTDGVQTCPCVIPAAAHNWDREDTFVPAHCGTLPYSMRVCKDCDKIEVTNYPGYWTGNYTDDKNTIKEIKPIVGLNHTPVAYVEGADKAANLKYIETDVYDYYLDENGNLRQRVTTITGIYTAYTEATFTTAGSATFVCSQCGEEVTIELPALTGLGFELVVENANGQEGITNGSLINVTLYANGNNVAVNQFTVLAGFGDMVFVGAQSATTDFAVHVTKADNANEENTFAIIANAVNTADKKQQNIVINGKAPIVTMQFVVLARGEYEQPAAMTIDVTTLCSAVALDGTAVDANFAECEIEVRELLDFNEDGVAMITDLIQAEAILTGESEKAYDVTVDADKDGEITLYDLNLIYEAIVNSVTEDMYLELLFAGLSEEHVEIVREALGLNDHKHACENTYCSYTSDVEFTVCPACGRAQ